MTKKVQLDVTFALDFRSVYVYVAASIDSVADLNRFLY